MIYVDPLFVMQSRDAQAFRVGARNGHRWCHLWCDGNVDALHALAARIGLRRAWFQDKKDFPHYDLTPQRRAAAVKAGAVEFELADWLRGKRPASTGQQVMQLTEVKP